MAFKMRSSKFRHVFGKELKKDQCYDGVRQSKVSADTKFCAVNPKFLAVMSEAAGGGAFLVLPLERTGRVERDVPLVTGHSGPVMDIKWNPFDDNMIASASEDCTVRIWQIPDKGLLNNLDDAIQILKDHQKRVNLIEWHPTANNIILSCGLDNKINLWNAESGMVIRSYDTPDMTNSASFNFDGTKFVVSCKDKHIRIYSAYEEALEAEFKAHESAKPCMCAYAKDNQIITTGFSRSSERQYCVFDVKNPDKPEKIAGDKIDNNNGVLQIEYDYDTGMIFLWGKGDSIIRYYELTEESPFMHYLSLYQAKESQKGMGWMVKRGCNVQTNEIARCYKIWNNGYCEVIPFTVPRKSELFQDDLYPDTRSDQAALQADQFEQGMTSNPILMSLRPDGAEVKKPQATKMKKPLTKSAPTPVQQETPKPAPAPAPAPTPVQKPVVEKTVSNGAAEPNIPPAQTGPALPPGFDAEKILKDIADLKTIIKRQDKTIAALEKRVEDLEVTSEEGEADNQQTTEENTEDNRESQEFQDCQE